MIFACSIRDQLNRFEGEHVNDGLQAARWCLRQNFIQQGYTILLETIVTAVLQAIGADVMDRRARESVTGAARVIQRGTQDKEKDLKDRFYVKSRNYLKKHEKLVCPITQLLDFRNDLNHAGWRDNPAKPNRFRTELEHLIDTIEPIVT